LKFEHDTRNLVLTLWFAEDEVVQETALLTVLKKAELLGYWEVRAIVPAQYRFSDLLFDWEFYGEADGTVAFKKTVGIRERTLGG
jgi:hypothetical protein